MNSALIFLMHAGTVPHIHGSAYRLVVAAGTILVVGVFLLLARRATFRVR